MTEQESPSAAERPDDPTSTDQPASQPPGVAQPAGAPPPVVAWAAVPEPSPAPGGWPSGITVGAVLSDAFARYAADPVRIFLVGLVPALLTMLTVGQSTGTGLVSLLSLIATSIVLVLADRGPRVSLGYAVGLGLRRFGWLLLTALVVGILVGLAAAIPLVVVIAVAKSNPGLAVVLALLLAIPVVWVLMRLTLAIPAVVVDDVRTNPGLDRARQATRTRGATFALFVVLVVANIAAVPVSLGAGALTVVAGIPPVLVLLIGGVLVAIVTPLGAIAQLSAYRRAFPPEPEPAPRTAPMTLAMPETADAFVTAAAPGSLGVAPPSPPPSTRQSPRVSVPPPAFGRMARGIAGLTIAIAILGIGSFGFAIVSAAAGALGNMAGNVPRGTIVFGSAAKFDTCTVTGPFTVMPAGGSVAWVGAFAHRTAPSDRIRLVIKFNGVQAVNEAEPSGTFDCLGSGAAESGLDAGRYDLALYVNDVVSAQGTLTVP